MAKKAVQGIKPEDPIMGGHTAPLTPCPLAPYRRMGMGHVVRSPASLQYVRHCWPSLRVAPHRRVGRR
jgi:hypothetical protein